MQKIALLAVAGALSWTGLAPATAQAVEVTVSTGPHYYASDRVYYRHHRRHYHEDLIWVPGHSVHRHHHKVWISGHYVRR